MAALVSGLLHAAVLYSLTKIPEIPHKESEYIRIEIGRIALLKEKKEKPQPKVVKRKEEHKRSLHKKRAVKAKKAKPRKVKRKKIVRKELKAVAKKDKPQRVSTALAKVKSQRKAPVGSKKITKNTAEGGPSIINKGTKEEGKRVAFSAPRVREDYGETYRRLNLSRIRRLVQESLNYPYIARRMGWEGKVSVEVVLTPEGCKRVSLRKGTGHKVLDKNALETVRKLCGKFPKPERKVVLLIPIVYKLN